MPAMCSDFVAKLYHICACVCASMNPQFLDATVSESCRLRESFASREVFATADARVQPAVAVAGAVGLFAADLAAIRYTTWLQRFPLLFNVAQV